jgi:hypothetical protein
MPRKIYTLAVVICALSWLVVGLHITMLHDLTTANAPRHWLPLTLLATFLVLAIADTWTLLRAPEPWARQRTSEPPAA